MRRRTLILRLLLCLLVPAAARAADFEGVIEGRMTGPHAKGVTLTSISAAGLRNEITLEMPAARNAGLGKVQLVSLYRNAEPDKVYILDVARKTYRVDAAGPKSEATVDLGWKVEKKGPTQIAGITCEQAELTSSRGDKVSACLSAEIGGSAPWVKSIQEGNSGITGGIAKALAAAGVSGYPLRWNHQPTGAASAVTLEVTSVKRQAVPAASVDLPAGYQKQAEPVPPPLKEHARRERARLTPEQRKQLQEKSQPPAPPAP